MTLSDEPTVIPIPRANTCRGILIACPHCVNRDHQFEAPWFLVDRDGYAALVAEDSTIVCRKSGCGREFMAADAITSETDHRFRIPQAEDGSGAIVPMWAALSCPSCMVLSEDGKKKLWVDVWAAPLLRCRATNAPYPCPRCKNSRPAKDYDFKRV